MWSLILLRQVLIAKSLLECQRLHRRPCALVEVKDLLGSFTRHSLKNCLGILRCCSYFDMVPYQSCYPWLRPADGMTKVMIDRSKDNMVKVLWWQRSRDHPMMTLKWTWWCDYLVTIHLTNWWWPLKADDNIWWHLMPPIGDFRC